MKNKIITVITAGLLGLASQSIYADHCSFLQKEYDAGRVGRTTFHGCEADFGKLLIFSVVTGAILKAAQPKNNKPPSTTPTTSINNSRLVNNDKLQLFTKPTDEGGVETGLRYTPSHQWDLRLQATEETLLDWDLEPQAEVKVEYSF